MKKLFAFILGLLLVADILFAQPWIYDFGTEIKSYSTTEHSNFGFLALLIAWIVPTYYKGGIAALARRVENFAWQN